MQRAHLHARIAAPMATALQNKMFKEITLPVVDVNTLTQNFGDDVTKSYPWGFVMISDGKFMLNMPSPRGTLYTQNARNVRAHGPFTTFQEAVTARDSIFFDIGKLSSVNLEYGSHFGLKIVHDSSKIKIEHVAKCLCGFCRTTGVMRTIQSHKAMLAHGEKRAILGLTVLDQSAVDNTRNIHLSDFDEFFDDEAAASGTVLTSTRSLPSWNEIHTLF